MTALQLTSTWPVPHVSAAIVSMTASATVVATEVSPATAVIGDVDRCYRLASISKPITAWAVLIAVEEGIIALDTPVGQPGCTLRHLLAHAGGYAFDGPDPVARPGRRRAYSNTGIELAAGAVAEAASMPFRDYLTEAVLTPLGMTSTALRGSPAHGIWSTLGDTVAFTRELVRPSLVSEATARTAQSPVFPELAGVIPGLGRFDPCPWGLGIEVRGNKQPHWTGTSNSPCTFGHFGGAGTFFWVDPGVDGAPWLACVALTDRALDEWEAEAFAAWPALSDAVLAEHRGIG